MPELSGDAGADAGRIYEVAPVVWYPTRSESSTSPERRRFRQIGGRRRLAVSDQSRRGHPSASAYRDECHRGGTFSTGRIEWDWIGTYEACFLQPFFVLRPGIVSPLGGNDHHHRHQCCRWWTAFIIIHHQLANDDHSARRQSIKALAHDCAVLVW